MTEFFEPTLYHSTIPVQAFQFISIARQKVSRVCYSFTKVEVEVTVEGVPNELYAQNMEYRHQYDEIMKHFGEGRLKDAGAIQKYLQLHNVNIALYYTDKYTLWLDF